MTRIASIYTSLFACVLAAIGGGAQAEDVVYDWTKTFGGTGNDGGESVATDASGNSYLTGYFDATVDFDPGTGTDQKTSNGLHDVFISKYDSSGNYQWTKTFGGNGNDSCLTLVTDSSGNIYLAGYFSTTVDFDPGAGTDTRTSAGSTDAFVSKYDSSGNYQWVKAFGGTGTDYSSNFLIDVSGNLYISGSFQATVDFDPAAGTDTRTSAGDRDAYLSKYDSSGNYQWTKALGGTLYDSARSVAADPSGNVYITGGFSDTVDFDPGVGTDTRTSIGDRDVFLSKYDSSGNYQWTRAFGGNGVSGSTGADSGYSVATDLSGNVYITGRFVGTVDFDPGAGQDERTSNGGIDVFLSKYDSSGNYQWTKAIGGTLNDGVNEHPLAVDSNGNLYLTGWFADTVDFDPGVGTDEKLANPLLNMIFLSKYDLSGNYKWTKAFGESSYSVTIDLSGNVYVSGFFYGNTVDVDPGAGTDIRTNAGSGSGDVMLSKFALDGTAPLAPIISFPTSGTSTSNTGISISGTAEANSTVTIYSDGISIGAVAANGSGAWTYTPSSALLDGSHSITATATDAANNTSGLSSAVVLTIDTVPPGASAVIPPVWGNRTDALTPGFSGTGDAGQTVRVWLDNNLVGTANIDQAGNWSWTPSSDLSIGSHSIEFSVIDAAGNESARSGSRTFQVVDDYDNDGLTTAEEVAQGTDSHDNDSDHDGVTDGQEVQDDTNPNNSDTDSDGLTDSQEKQYRTNPNNRDSDSDGITDGQEIQNGTSPLDRGSVLSPRDTTLCTEWNGYLGMWNILEHLNQGSVKLNMESTLRNLFGEAQGTLAFGLKPGYQYDLLVHDMSGYQRRNYGLLCSSATNGHPGDLDGRMVFYKPDLATGGYQYAFAVPLGNGLTGKQYIPYNTYQPSLDPVDSGNLAANWIQLTNLSATKQTGSLVFYDREGKEIARQAVTLKAGGRFDFSAHDIAGRKEVGIAEWIPTHSDAHFQLRNVRYYYRADGVNVPLGDDFDSAFQLEGIIGSGNLLAVPLDTNGSSAVLELANTQNEEVKAEVTIYPTTGGTPLHHQNYKLKPHATYHLIVDNLLNGQEGIATVQGSKPESVIATAMQYGRTASLGIQTVYGLQASEPLGTVMRGSYNTFLKQGCRLLMVNPTSADATATVAIKRYDGTNVQTGREFAIPAHGLSDYDLCSEDEDNAYGVVTVQPATPNTIFATVLRVGESEQYRFPTPVRE